MPSVAQAPPATLGSPIVPQLPVLDQGRTNACTGFALASVINLLLRRSKQEPNADVSPFMLYSMARRYDEFPGAAKDTGSSLRGAMKGWYKQGACRQKFWSGLRMPPAQRNPGLDWWQDAVGRPLGAYYRVDVRSVTDMQVALLEVGVLYASATCHAGWDLGFHLAARERQGWSIPQMQAGPGDGGHAFAVVGYDQVGFKLLNSWGRSWGHSGFATLTYEDWLANAMDCWVAQLGVVTELHRAVAASATLRQDARSRVIIAADETLRNREIGPFIVDMENNGRLSTSGDFRTSEGDLKALVQIQMAEARRRWNLSSSQPMDVAIYAHGGLTGEDTAAATAGKWIPALYDAQVFPIFFMWETGLWSTFKDRLSDALHGEPRPTGGFRDTLIRFWDKRLERGLAGPGTTVWGEMKQNARAIADNPKSGANILYRLSRQIPEFKPAAVRLHLIGHSAGAIVHCHLAKALGDAGWTFRTVNFMAPAVRVDTFRDTLLPVIKARKVARYNQFHLTASAEEKDPTCRSILGYSRSLLYLVSESFEGGVTTPILGMQKFFDAEVSPMSLASIKAFPAPGRESSSTTHGGFDDDLATMTSIIKAVTASRAVSSSGTRSSSRTGRRRRTNRRHQLSTP